MTITIQDLLVGPISYTPVHSLSVSLIVPSLQYNDNVVSSDGAGHI